MFGPHSSYKAQLYLPAKITPSLTPSYHRMNSNSTETDSQSSTQYNSATQAEALELVLLAFAVVLVLLLIRADTFVLGVGGETVWEARAPRRLRGRS